VNNFGVCVGKRALRGAAVEGDVIAREGELMFLLVLVHVVNLYHVAVISSIDEIHVH